MNPSNTNSNYIFSTPARWRNGGYGPAMSAPKGVLGLTREGRVEFWLDNGKVLFSAPVALTKRKYERTYGWLRIVVGPRLYTFQFYTADVAATGVNPNVQLLEARKGDALFKHWKQKLEEAAMQAADARPIVAASVPTSLRTRAQSIRRRVIFGMLLVIFLPLGIALPLIFLTSMKREEIETILYVFVAPLIALYFFLLNRWRKKLDAAPLPIDEIGEQPGDILPAGTLPSASFGLTTAKQIIFGTSIVVALAIVVVVVLVMILTGGHGLTKY